MIEDHRKVVFYLPHIPDTSIKLPAFLYFYSMKIALAFYLLLISVASQAQLLQQKNSFTEADTLRGSVTKYRQWDVQHYALEVQVSIEQRMLHGKNEMTYLLHHRVDTMQIDLQWPMVIDSVLANGKRLPFIRRGNAWMVVISAVNTSSFFPAKKSIAVYFHGTPKEAINPPWDGGVMWSSDSNNKPLVATACQGIGASVWWPCKDHQSDEPDEGMVITIVAPSHLKAVSNGRLKQVKEKGINAKAWMWELKNPINTYNVTMNIGNYVSWQDSYRGEGGTLDMEYWVLPENLEKSKRQFTQTRQMLACFESWFGKYPFYEDGFKLIETPFLGMEHQSGIAYGNEYKNGYRGIDYLSGTGWGLKWDYIIVHESGHEWFGNSITTKDIADMWVHEGFTTYSEILFTECMFGKDAAEEYALGIKKRTTNNKSLIGTYGVHQEGSGDLYRKGASLIHVVRNLLNDDEKFKNMLRKMNSTFYHKTTTSAEVEAFIIRETGLALAGFFDQYLRSDVIPTLEYYYNNKNRDFCFRLGDSTVKNKIPVAFPLAGTMKVAVASSEWNSVTLPAGSNVPQLASAIEAKNLLHTNPCSKPN